MTRNIAILSLCDYLNYGNTLQRIAVQRLLAKRGWKGVSLDVREHPVLGRVKDFVRQSWPDRKKDRIFRRFNEEAGVKIISCKPGQVVRMVNSSYTGAVIGSDQVWNPRYSIASKKSGLCCLEGVPKNKKIALSPSFGLPSLPEDYNDLFKEWLKGFYRLSVRETAGCRIIEELTGKPAEVLIDPTMALSAEEWRAIADYSKCPKDNYILTYFLGDGAVELTNAVKAKAQNDGLVVVNLMDRESDWYLMPPDAFIALIDRASAVVTDSFHGSAFSLLMHTDFYMVERNQASQGSMLSRLETLSEKFDCESRFILSENPSFDVPAIDWAAFETKLSSERINFANYLDEGLANMGLGGAS